MFKMIKFVFFIKYIDLYQVIIFEKFKYRSSYEMKLNILWSISKPNFSINSIEDVKHVRAQLDSLATTTLESCWRRGQVDAASGRTASVCVPEHSTWTRATCSTGPITCGARFTLDRSVVGCTPIRARTPPTSHSCTRSDGRRSSPMSSLSHDMSASMSLGDTLWLTSLIHDNSYKYFKNFL